jgi:hypothetical protein
LRSAPAFALAALLVLVMGIDATTERSSQSSTGLEGGRIV